MRKQYRAEAAQISPTESSTREAERARIDAEPVPPRQPKLSIGDRVWFIDSDARWYELEVVERTTGGAVRVTFKPVTGWDSVREVEWAYGALFEFSLSSPLSRRLRPLSARRS